MISSSATAAEARAAPVTSGSSGRRQRRAEAVAEELRHVLVKVEQERHAAELLRQGREGRKSGHGGHLDQVVVPLPMLAREAPGGHGGEGEVLGDVAGEADEGCG